MQGIFVLESLAGMFRREVIGPELLAGRVSTIRVGYPYEKPVNFFHEKLLFLSRLRGMLLLLSGNVSTIGLECLHHWPVFLRRITVPESLARYASTINLEKPEHF